MFNPIIAEALARARHADLLLEAETTRRARQARRASRRHQAEIGYALAPQISCGT